MRLRPGYREAGEIQFHTLPRDGVGAQCGCSYSSAFECTTCHRAYREPEPRLFSFNNPFGACPRCQGFGNTIDFDPGLIIPDRSKTLDDGCGSPVDDDQVPPAPRRDEARSEGRGRFRPNVPWYDLTAAQQRFIEDGDKSFSGIRGFFAALDRKKYKLHVRVFLSKYRGYATVPGLSWARGCGQRLARC